MEQNSRIFVLDCLSGPVFNLVGKMVVTCSRLQHYESTVIKHSCRDPRSVMTVDSQAFYEKLLFFPIVVICNGLPLRTLLLTLGLRDKISN